MSFTFRPHGDRLHFWSEKLPLALAMAAQALVVTRWYIGDAPLAIVSSVLTWANVVIAIAAGLAFDLVVVTTVMARRDGRRSGWGVATGAAAALASALIALDVYGGWTPGPYLHIAYPVVVFLFSMHLSSPREVAPNRPLLAQRRTLIRRLVQLLRGTRTELHMQGAIVAQLRTEAARLAGELAHAAPLAAQTGQEAAHWQQRAAHAEAEAAQRSTELARAEQEAARARAEAAHTEQEAARLRRELAQRDEEAARLLHAGDLDLLAIAQKLSQGGTGWREIGTLLRVPESTLRNRLKARTNGHLVEVP